MRRVLLLLVLVLSVGCSLRATAPPPTQFPTATTVSDLPTRTLTVPTATSLPATTVPTVTVAPTQTVLPTVTQTRTPAPTATDDGCGAESVRTTHTVQAQVDYAAKQVTVQQQIVYVNATDAPLETVVLNVEPNRWLNVFTLQALTVNGGTDGFYDLTGRRLEVLPAQPLQPDCTLTLELDFSLDMPEIIGGREAFRGYFGQTSRQINLGHWLPTVVPRVDGEWLHHEVVTIGEQIVLDPADWTVTFELVNATDETIVAAPGELVEQDGDMWTYQHTNGREFGASISHTFRQSTATAANGVPVDVYSFPDAIVPHPESGEWIDSGQYAARVTAESVALYAEKFGPYPHERMVIVQGDFPDGMEFSGFAFVSTDWFTGFTGDPKSYLMLITVHEVAHQWWYDLVGNDQAYDPWLDEALATYSEYIYIEEYYPELTDWWWWFRVNRLNPDGRVSSSVYDFDRIRPYINAVYLRGVLMLDDVRTTLGDEAFYAWLRRYAETNAGHIADGDDLWNLLTPAQQDATAVIRTMFLRDTGG